MLAAYEAPFPTPESKAGARAFPLMLPTSPEMPGAAAGKRVLEALRTDERPKLHLWADSDPIIPFKVGERFAAAINADPPEKIENASHFLQEDAGEQVGAPDRRRGWRDSHEDVTGPLYRLGGFCARHAKAVFGFWIVFVIADLAGRDRDRQADLRRHHDPRLGLDRGDRPARAEAAQAGQRLGPDRARGDQGKLTEGANKQAVQKTVKAAEGERVRPAR